MTETTPTYHEDNAMVTAEQVGNQSAFRSLVDRPRRELQVHCFGLVAEAPRSEPMCSRFSARPKDSDDR